MAALKYPGPGPDTAVAVPAAWLLCIALAGWTLPAASQVITPAVTGQSCAGTRFGSNLNCTSNDFSPVVNFSQPPGGPSTCVAGQFINVDVIGTIQSNSPERFDGALFISETGSSPSLNNAAQSCSLGVFPTSPAPFQQVDGDACGDFAATSSVGWELTGVRVRCQAVPGSNVLAIPYTLVFDNLNKTGCSAATVTAGTTAKCSNNTGAGLTGVTVLGHVTLTKQTNPDGSTQRFDFTSTASSGQTPQWTLGGAPTGSNLVDGQTKRITVPLSATGGSVTLTIAELATTFWEPGVTISCAAAPGAAANPATVNNATRTITANLTNANFAADCTITNTRRSRVTIAKSVTSRAAPSDQFRVSATGGGTLTDATGNPVTAPVSVTTTGSSGSAQVTFWSQPGQALTVTETAASGSLSNYTSSYACTNATAGSPTTLPGGTGTSLALTPAPGDDITCTFTNTANAVVGWTLDKTTASTPVAAGDTIAYAFSLTNTGTVGITGIVVTDPLLPGLSCTLASLAAGATASCAATGNVYTVSQADVDAGSVSNTATATGTPASGALAPATDGVVVAIAAAPTLAIVKSDPANADNDGSGSVTLGDVLTYTVTATNTGNVTLSGVVVSDPRLTPGSNSCPTLAPAATCVLTGTHVVTAAEITAGQVVNTASADSDQTGAVTDTVTTLTTVRVISASDDSGSAGGAGGGTAVASVLANDTLNGVAVNPADVTLTQVSTTSPNVTLNPATGAVSVAPGTPAGTHTVVYRLCENLNPTNCDTASVTVTVTAAAVAANDDSGSAGGAGGGTAVANVLANDTLNGAAVNPASVTLSQISTTSPNVILNPATGAVSVAADTPAGSYTVVYRLCENLNPTNCDTASVTVTVSAGPLLASADAGSAGGADGGVAVANVLANDTLNGVAVNAADVTLTQVSTTSPNVTLNPATGAVSVAADTPAGTYTVVYQVCEKLNPANCDTASVTVTVTAAVVAANDDSGGAGGTSGGTAVANVLANDTLGGQPMALADVTLTQVSTSNPAVTLDPATGAVSVAPGTPAGAYTVVYQVCENLNPANCDTASVMVTVSAALLDANADTRTVNGTLGGTAPPSVLANDTLNGVAVNPADVTLSQVSTTDPAVTLNTGTGQVTVAPGTPAGTYTVVYQACENLNPTNCDSASITVTVTAAAVAANDDGGSAGGRAGGVAVANVVANDTLGGVSAVLADLTLTQVSTSNPAVTLNPATGAVSVAAGTPAGTYTVVYQLCENLNPTNCDTATVTITVTAAAIVANDQGGSVGGRTGGVAVASVVANDRLGGQPVALADVTLTQVSTSDPAVALNPATGAVSVAPGTAAGTYTLVYRLCENLNPTNCDTATVTVTVTAATVVASDDSGSVGGRAGGVVVANVTASDTLGGQPVALADVTLTQVSTSDPAVALNPATGAVSVASGTAAGTYTLVYGLCENLNPANCDTATVTITVTAATIAANDDGGSAEGIVDSVLFPTVLANDRLGGQPVDPADVTLTEVSSTDPGVTLDTVTAQVGVAAGTPAGTYTLVYGLCENLNPANCDTATVTVTVTAAAIVANPDSAVIDGEGGGNGPGVLDNDTLAGAPVDPAAVTLAQLSTTDPNVTLDPATGQVTVAPGTPAGTYTVVYEFCEILNPANCASASVTVTVTAASILADDDDGSTGGRLGGVAVADVRDNDTLGGGTVDPAEVTLTQLSTTDPAVTLDTATGAVSVAAGTPAGTYTLVYRLCENLNPTNCDTASVVVEVEAAVLQAGADERSSDDAAGGDITPGVLDNDTIDGDPVDPAEVTLTQVSTTDPGVTLDPATGLVNVAPGTPAGTYVLVYQACEVLNPTNCVQGSVTVSVSAPPIVANPDDRSVDGNLGGTVLPAVLDNDTLGGVAVDPADVTLIEVSSTSPNLSLDTLTGEVSVAAGTAAGTYTLVYRICEVVNPGNCSQAAVTVAVSAAALVASDDSGSVNGATGGAAIAGVLTNDRLGGVPADPAAVTLVQVSSSDPGISLDPATGRVSVAPGTPAGAYTLVYQVCEDLNPANCDTATAAVTVTAAGIVASPDARSVGGRAGGTAVPSVLANDTLNGALVNPADVTLVLVSSSTPNLELDPSTGMVHLLPGTPVGTYTLVYEFCELLNPTNCAQGTVTVTATAAPMVASADSASISGLAGGTAIASVLANDRIDGAPMPAGDVLLSLVAPADPGLSLDTATGAVSVAPGTPQGTYSLEYRVCERLNPDNCTTATATVRVTAGSLVARGDSGTVADGDVGGVAVDNVLDNDTLGGIPVSPGDLVLTGISSTSPGIYLDTDTGKVQVAPATPAGEYTLVYQVCEILNPANCAQASVSVVVVVVDLAPVARDDSFAVDEGQSLDGDLAANDTPGNLQNTYSLVPGTGPAGGSVTVAADGTFSYVATPGFVGTDSFVYQVCDAGGDCATATVSIAVAPQPGKLRVEKSSASREVGPASLVAFTVTLTNISSVPVRDAELLDQPPRGLSVVAGSVVVEDEDAAGEVTGSGPFTVSGIDVPVGGTATVRYLMRVSAGLPAGEYVNVASAWQVGVPVSNSARASIVLASGADPDTEQARVLGKVFHDRNGDGWQDEGERGIPGVRVVTVEGLVAETDAWGRYHFEGLTLSNAARGQNFVVKVDRATLPAGSAFTTENPLVRRVTQGLPARFDFGVRLPVPAAGAAPGGAP